MPPRALLFDLFGTVIHFSARVPIVEVAGTRWVTTMDWLRPQAEASVPEVAFDRLLAALFATTEEIVRARAPEYLEVPSAERFRRALAKVGIEGDDAEGTARELSLAHMRHLASTTFLPEHYADILQQLRSRYRLALVSNFDHAPTARGILETHGIAELFEVSLISDDFGRRKPHRSIFDAACAAVGVTPGDAWFIGDNPKEDIAGALSAGLTPVWVNASNDARDSGAPFVIRDLHGLPELCRDADGD